MIKRHPIRKAILVLRCWLALVMCMMLWNALVSLGFLLDGRSRAIPFVFFAVVAGVWLIRSWHSMTVIIASSALAVGTFMRGMEVVLFADELELRARLTGASLWITISGTAIAFGILNVLAVSRKTAEDWVWREKAS